MPISPPSLDDRRFDDLVNELIARIPAHTPEWTNPRLGDPGRTLIELFAWLTDTLLYRANLIPERQRLVFLKLIGEQLRPAQPATGIVALSYAQATVLSGSTLKPGARIKAAQPFETLSETTVLPITAEAYYKQALSSADSTRLGEVLSGLASVHRSVVGGAAVKGYETTAVFDAGRAEPEGIDVVARSVDRALWLALLAPPAAKPELQAGLNETIRMTLGGGDSGSPALLSIGVVPTATLPTLFEDIGARARIPVLWELTTQGRDATTSDYLTLQTEPGSDSSQGLARPGVLRLRLPPAGRIWAPDNDVGNNPAAGVGDNPPRLDDLAKASRLLAWLRLRPQPGQNVERLALSWLGINAVQVDQRSTLSGRVIGVSTGSADQRFALPQGSVDPDSLKIEVEEPGLGYRPWTRVDELAAISSNPNVLRDARAYELDAEAGNLRFGDGVRGRVPEAQMRIRLATGRFGGGLAGNLPAGSLTEASGALVDGGTAPPLKVTQPLATREGADAETLDQAEKRIPATLRHRDRAVTANDYRALALSAPGIEVGRVEVLPRFKPRDRRFDMPGVVSVLALPAQAYTGGATPGPNPRPDRPFIERLHAHLSARTPLATELYVIGCEYIALGVSVAVTLAEGAAHDATLFQVREMLCRALWPLPPGGAGGSGWPLGRDVHSRELLVDVARVPGVLEVSGLNLFLKSGSGDTWQQKLPGSDGNAIINLQRWQLPELLSVVAVLADDRVDLGGSSGGRSAGGAPTDLRAAPNPFAQGNAVAVPVVPETC